MDAAAMIEERRLKQSFVLATLASTIAGTFITGINLFDRVNEKRKHRKQRKLDKGQDKRLSELERRVDENFRSINEQLSGQQRQLEQGPPAAGGGRIRDDDLRDSLEQGGPMVQREYDRHYAAMGPQFAEGDLIAQNQLQSQIITLQSTVIKLLEEALFTGNPPDMAKLYNASELARIGSIRALRDQAERLHQSQPINRGQGVLRLRPAERGPGSRPIGLIRRTSSTPSLRSSSPSSSATTTTTTSTTTDTSNSTSGLTTRRAPNRSGYGYEPPRKSLTFPNQQLLTNDEESQKSGPLFCRYARDLQQNPRLRLDENIFLSSSPGCPACGAIIPSTGSTTGGGGHLIDREVVVTERLTTTTTGGGGGSLSVTVGGNPVPVTELVKRFEDRTYLVTPRFLAKCHRVGAERPGGGGKGYACYLCFRNREKDSLLKTVRGLVGHVRDKHDIGEYEAEVDIRRV